MGLGSIIRDSLLVVGLLQLPTHRGYTHWTPLRLNTLHQQYLLKNYERIVQEQQEKYHFVFQTVPDYFYRPKDGPWDPGAARYDPESGTILFSLVDQYLADLFNDLRRPIGKELKIIDETARHELGHDYFFERAQEYGMQNYWAKETSAIREELDVIDKIVEGTAEYMQRRRSEHHSRGYSIVKPILDIDFKKGIDWIIQHPPQENEWKDLSLYQQRAVRELSS